MQHKKDTQTQRERQSRNRYDVDEYLDEKINLANFRYCIKYIARVKWRMISALILSISGSLIGLSGPLFIQQALDVAVPQKNLDLLAAMALLLAASIVLSIGLGAVRNILVARAGQIIIHDIRYDLFAHLQSLPFSYYDSRPNGKIFVRVVPYVNSVSDALSNGILNFIIEILNILFIMFFMFQVSANLALVTIMGLPVLASFIWSTKTRQRRAWQRVSNKNSNLNAYIQESIDGARVTQAFDRQKHNSKILDRLAQERNKEWMNAIYISNTVWFSTETISQIVFSFVYIMGAYWMNPMASFGMLLAMGNYTWRFWQPIINLGNIYNTFVNGMAYLDRIFDTIAEPVIVRDAPDAKELPPIRGHVQFDSVSFSYDKEHSVLKNISFIAEPSDSIALVGPTGAGKTTIVNLLSRFYNIEEGKVLIDGYDIMNLSLRSLRKQMGIMLQDSFIFTATIADNIHYGKLDATDSQIKAAANLIGAHSFIEKLPQGYDTIISEHGGGISHGEKQLITFARTLLSDPRILVLDEATSSIDTGTEQFVQEGIRTLMKGRTSFFIAHRLSTIRECSRILYINDGQIIESGTHSQLMDAKGAYYRLCKAQYTL